MKKVILLFLVTVCICANAQDLDHFTRLKSEGPIPGFFVKFLDEKIESDNENLKNERSISDKNAQNFSAITNYKLQKLIQGGKVLYGDPLTNYANGVLDKLKAASSENLDHIQLYTLKSNEVNAFATHQGVIFITVGLIGQLENEAQLAFTIAHELTHVIKKHNQLTYQHTQDLIKKSRYGDGIISDFYKYSKENEEESDKAGFQLAIKAGYDANALYETFTVLLYSYLPIDEQPVDYAFFENESFKIGEKLRLKEDLITPISAEEDLDDEFLTHPNIGSRRKNISSTLNAYKNEPKSKVFVYGTAEQFNVVRDIARFEMLNIFIQRADYVRGLYHSMIMLKEKPNNTFLVNCQSMIWYGLSAFENRSKDQPYSFLYRKKEGEIQKLYFLLSKLNSSQLSTIATQQIWQNSLAAPENTFLKSLRTEVLVDFASYSDNNLDNFGREAFTEQKEIPEEKSDEELSKYEKIAKKRKVENTENAFYYALLNVINHKDFILAVDEAQDKVTANKKRDERVENGNSKPKESQLDISSLIMTTPDFYLSDNRKSTHSTVKKNELTETTLIDLVQENANKLDIQLNFIDNFKDPNFTTENYNEFSLLYDYIGERSHFEGLDFLPYNAQYIGDITKKYNTNYVGLIGIYTEIEKKEFNGGLAALSVLVFYALPFYLKWQLTPEKTTDYAFYVLNLETHNPTFRSSKFFEANMNIHLQSAHIYNSLNQIRKK